MCRVTVGIEILLLSAMKMKLQIFQPYLYVNFNEIRDKRFHFNLSS